MHKDIITFLQSVGLTKTEISLYVAGVQQGASCAADLAKHTGIQRTTAYSALASLEQKGMAGLQLQNGVQVYVMEPPATIEHKLQEQVHELTEKQKDFAEVLPLFDALATESVGTSVAKFSGIDGVRTVIDTALFCASRQWKIIAPTKNFLSESDKVFADYFIKTRKQRNIVAQSLWEQSFISKRKFSQATIDMRSPRILPKAVAGKFKSTVILFDAKVAFINSAAEKSAVLIDSKDIHDTMEVFFDGVWASAKAVPRRYIK